ncbi:hypothetical protein [Methylocaldum sp. RMAD-M]|jgi:hypothetical protein|uniref:hypothetical protein n=1 Tax=Methylocaldum sp. RMAD-M TaxID=2806557 RepID=UPI00143DE9D4|nr:hypothetical protein [Methylocaldum sp. RMAD-M]MBP1151149.1 hypothetical protein [Methylocaldum sp. RMAD-M]
MTAWTASSSVIHRQFYAELDEPHAGKPSRGFGINWVRLFLFDPAWFRFSEHSHFA